MTRRFGSKENYERHRIMKHGERCGTCYFSRPTPDLRIVVCKRKLWFFPMPSGKPGIMGQLIIWPELPKEEWCGEWRMRILIDAELQKEVEVETKP